MVSPSFIALGLAASVASAASHSKNHTLPVAAVSTEHSTLTAVHSAAHEKAKNGTIKGSETTHEAGEPTAPWQFRVFSENFVPAVASLRKPDVPESVASSVAKHLVYDALKPTQYTSLMREGFEIFNYDGYYPDATSLYHLATDVSSAYDEIHTDLSYWSYVDYVRSAASLFEPEKLKAGASIAATNTRYQEEKRLQSSYYSEVYNSLKANPTGSAALETLSKVAEAYQSDFRPAGTEVSIIEKALMKALNFF